jgi:hypothetical protein
MKALPPNPTKEKLEWLLRLTAAQFLVRPADLRRDDRTAWLVAARDSFCAAAYMHQLASHREIGAILGRDRTTVICAIKRATDRIFLRDDLTALATTALSRRVAAYVVGREGPFVGSEEMPPKTPSEGGMSAGRPVPTAEPPSRASNPGHNAAQRTSSHPLTSLPPE